ncbi:hypothetical protein Daesc_006021 [Daldinia eschscholtzii]|uniref:N-acetyltransferase domain-containing protein n=1 Tax=Daldinia eschscholtzii TaxID=292717 RepID=A0AAX6MMK5_9PEZI
MTSKPTTNFDYSQKLWRAVGKGDLTAMLKKLGELIGEGGIHTLESSSCGWPEIGYRFKKEVWGQGYATEFLKALLRAWWDLPRRRTRLRVHSSSIQRGRDVEAVEQIHANTDLQNIGSQKVLAKLGFVLFSEYTEPDTQEHRIGESLALKGYRLALPCIDTRDNNGN